jgi:clathrin heavy chain
VQGTSDPEKVFDRAQNLENTQIINYRVEPNEKWCVLVGIAPGAPERYGLKAANLSFPVLTSEKDVDYSVGMVLRAHRAILCPFAAVAHVIK